MYPLRKMHHGMSAKCQADKKRFALGKTGIGRKTEDDRIAGALVCCGVPGGQLCCAFRGAETAWLYESGRDGHRRYGSDGRIRAADAGREEKESDFHMLPGDCVAGGKALSGFGTVFGAGGIAGKRACAHGADHVWRQDKGGIHRPLLCQTQRSEPAKGSVCRIDVSRTERLAGRREHFAG